MPDPTSGSNAVAQIILAAGTAGAALIGALVLWPTRRRRERVAETAAADATDFENGPARLRERLTALETTVRAHGDRIDDLDDDLRLLRAQEIAVESLARDRRPAPRKRTHD